MLNQHDNVSRLPVAPRREALLRPIVLIHRGRLRAFADTQELWSAVNEVDAVETAKLEAAEAHARLADAARREREWAAKPWLARLPFLIAAADPDWLLVGAGLLIVALALGAGR